MLSIDFMALTQESLVGDHVGPVVTFNLFIGGSLGAWLLSAT